MSRYFGTDGYRGRVGQELTAERACEVGKYLGYMAVNVNSPGTGHRRPGILIGEDTRVSSPMLRDALCEGAMSMGADCFVVGVTTTPSLSVIMKKADFDYAAMITASHNPYFDNGIKVMDSAGSKLSDRETQAIDAYLCHETELPSVEAGGMGRTLVYPEARDIYINFLMGVIEAEGLDFSGRRVVIDCANGAAYEIAPALLPETKAEIVGIGVDPDGVNINLGVGSTHPEALSDKVREVHADMGFAFDGDADRCLMVDETGSEIGGDQLVYLLATDLKRRGKLTGNRVVLTRMSNLGVLRALEREGIGYEITDVGDKYVAECMAREGLVLGGEQSGHIICGEFCSTGDGMLTAVMAMAAIARSGAAASEILARAPLYPQVLKNVPVGDKETVLSDTGVLEAIREAEERLSGEGRILVRPSGTEPLIRVMAEALSEAAAREAVDRVIAAIPED